MTGNNNSPSSSSPLDRYSVQPQQKKDDSPFYKSTAPTVSLPKGGGALKGIDEKFSVNAVNGTAGLEIPLPLSPGRGGFTPALSLSYNSGSGNSEFGLGFSLGLPGIQRKTDKRLPRYNDTSESDVFLLAGAEDLVPLPDYGDIFPGTETIGSYIIKRYRPRIEGLFARIEYIKKTTGGSGGWWRVTTKDNITTYYGLTAEGRIADPTDACRIFKWLPQLTVDHKGNVQQYVYKVDTNDNGVTIPSAVNEKNRRNGNAKYTNTYLKQVLYCNQKPYFIDDVMDSSDDYKLESDIYMPELSRMITENGEERIITLAEDLTFLMEAVLDYGDHSNPYNPMPNQSWPSRRDAFSDFHAGFEIRTYRKCRRVLMFHHFQELDGYDLIRALELTYKDDENDDPFSEADLITAATQRGYTYDTIHGWQNKTLPAMTFDYQPLKWNTDIEAIDKDDFRNAPQGLTGPYQWVDFEGEGISGILTEQGGGWFYKNNLGHGCFDTAKSITSKPDFTGLGGGGLQWQDLDADGRRQVVSEAPVKGFWELDDDQNWKPFQTFAKNLNIDWNSPFTKMLDLNGDGKSDIIITEDRAWTWYENLGKDGFDTGGNSPVFNDEEKGPVLLLRDAVQSIFLADINGDGMTDLVRIKNGEVCYWPNMGYGKFGAKVTMANAPVFQSPDIYNPLYLSLADITGTGAADLIYVGENKCTAWVNLSGNAWSEPTDINPLPGTDNMSKIAVLDFLGNGTGCIVWSSPLPQHATAPLQYIDLMKGKKPYLMKSYHSGMGKSVSVTYKSSTKFYLDDKHKGISWATRLPFPMQCIECITTTDSVSGASYTQSYRYRHGYYDHEEREFRGFGYVETKDIETAVYSETENLDQKPVLTKTWNHTGAWLREESLLQKYQQEYFQLEDWDNTVPVAILPDAADLNAQEWREAHRALKGSPLRQEVYALDGDTEKQSIPYSVTATTYKVKLIQPQGDNRYASFINLQEQSIAFSCERDMEDARVAHQLTLDTDEYGNVKKSASIAYPRKDPPAISGSYTQKVKDEQEKMHISYSENFFTNDIVTEDNHYRLRVGCEAKAYEVFIATDDEHYPSGLWTATSLLDYLEPLLPDPDDPGELIPTPIPEIGFSDNPSGDPEKKLLSHSKVLFKDNDAADTLDFGQIESLAIPRKQFQLVFAGKLLGYCYDGLVDAEMMAEGGYKETYVFTDASTGNPVTGFIEYEEQYWLPSGTAAYTNPVTKFYTPEHFYDPWGNETRIYFWDSPPSSNLDYINYWLLPKATEDAKYNTATIESYDWRTLQPLRMRDANNNISEILYDALGMPVAMAFKGKDEGTEGDTLDDLDLYNGDDAVAQSGFFNNDPELYAGQLLKGATWRCVYDFSSVPAAVGMIARQQHVYLPDGYPEEKDPPPHLIRISYSDGMGRVLMHKAQCEPTVIPGEGGGASITANWIGSGRTIYNNKGNAVMQFEPYFSDTYHCEAAELATNVGVSPRLYYDALGRNYRTDLPDGSFTKTEWTAWEQIVWDNNDTVLESDWYAAIIALIVPPATGPAGETMAEEAIRLAARADTLAKKDAAAKAAAHANTPTVMHTDTLARPFYTIQILEAGPTVAEPVKAIVSYVTLDVLGNRISIRDGNDNEPLQYRYNMLKQPCYQHSIDSGDAYTLTDAAGQPLYHWDADGREFFVDYDVLRRPEQKRVRIDGLSKTLELMVYGDNNDLTFYGDHETVDFDPQELNLRGQLYDHYDGSGRQWVPQGYDFKGNPVIASQRLLQEQSVTDVDWSDAYDVLKASTFKDDWSGFQDMLETGEAAWSSHAVMDALNRPITMTDPGENITRHTYDKAGALKQVFLAPNNDSETVYVKDIHYDAKGQRKSIWYGNHTKTRYTYDPQTYRLKRLLTTRRESDNSHTTLQDLNYYYDPVGNITTINDAVQPTLFYNNSMIEAAQSFTYDALYRLVEATGRELVNDAFSGPEDNFCDEGYTGTDLGNDAVRNYTQHYEYDAVGNILSLQHSAGPGSYTREYDYNSGTNRLQSTTIGIETYNYNQYDARGNMKDMPHLDTMLWNSNNELNKVERSTITAYYQYSGGQRVRKFVDKGGGIKEERIYLGNFEIYRKFDSGSSLNDIVLERTTVHISDDTGHIAMLELRNTDYDADDCEDVLIRYVYSNHLQSATLELDGEGEIITYEEYHPYGTSAYKAKNDNINALAKRYRYTGKERDEESGLYYHGARYYIPWLCRWTSVDPLESKYAGMSPYNYSFNNPVVWNDLSGADPNDPKGNSFDSTGQNKKIDVSGPASHVMEDGSIVIDQMDRSMKTVVSKKGGITVTQDVSTAAPISPPSPTADEILNDAYSTFIKKMQAEDYAGAINVIIDKYNLNGIVNKNLMSILFVDNMGVHQYLETDGIGEGKGISQSTQISKGDLFEAGKSKDYFKMLVVAITHEYIHGRQKAIMGMSDHIEREFLANQFSTFPNNSILAREGTINFTVEFPTISAGMKFTWAANAINYYSQLPPDLQQKYKNDAIQLLDAGLKAYKETKVFAGMEAKSEKLYKYLIDFKNSIQKETH
ncbi:insecticidal toxin complex protein [Taibaiella lutea]|uniref:Insecticidal toxin complex protein n=1 Tax=Taibaiella lutea TaxID=2608001 RepID=A0A5M6CEW2_9BACT|nr:SpvB/TcaC N-terminal domain-containing protein [Taibaiella lutea]KAA5533738.1 insecticidal toxin complex protein [Taibaiella lutea]